MYLHMTARLPITSVAHFNQQIIILQFLYTRFDFMI